jgi:hypothetical protein
MLPSLRRKRVRDGTELTHAPLPSPRLRGERELLEWLQRIATVSVDVELWERGTRRSARPTVLVQIDSVAGERSSVVARELTARLQEREGPLCVHAVFAFARGAGKGARAHLLPPGTPPHAMMGILTAWFDEVHGERRPSFKEADPDRTEALGQLYEAEMARREWERGWR